MDETAAAARSLRLIAKIDSIDRLVVHGDDVPLFAAAIDAEANYVARPKSALTKTYHIILLWRIKWFSSWFVLARGAC